MFSFIVAFLVAWGTLCNVAVATVTPIVATANYVWKDGYLYYGNYLVGCWNGQKYYGWSGSSWIEGTPCPTENPAANNYGVDTSKIKKNQASINGKDCSREQAIQALEKGGLTDDTNKLHLTVYGEGREGVIQDVQRSPLLTEFKDRFQVQSYPADHWAVKPDLHYPPPVGNKPVVLIQDNTGRVIHCQKDYDDGSKGLAVALAESLRRPVPHTDPSKFPDLRKGVKVDDLVAWLTSKSPLGVAWWVVIATVGIIYYINRKKPASPVVVNVPSTKENN